MIEATEFRYYTMNVYGRLLTYLADPVQAKYVSQLTGRPTVNKSDLEALANLFYIKLEEVLPPKK